MNISGVRENKFWIVLGGAIVFMAILYVLFGNPYRRGYSKRIGEIESALVQLEMYERKGVKIINEKWIEAEDARLKAIEKAQLKYKELLKERDYHIEKFFGVGNEGEIKDEALWKNSYVQRVDLLRGNLMRSNITAGRGALPFKEWGDEIPKRDKIVEEQKKFWITEELLNIIQKKELKISNIESISFRQEGVSPGNTHPELYETIHFTIKLSMDTEEIPFLIDELLKSKIRFEVETFNINGRLNKLRTLKKFEQSEEISYSTGVNIIINAYAIDFKA
jgi:hypothetical protein